MQRGLEIEDAAYAVEPALHALCPVLHCGVVYHEARPSGEVAAAYDIASVAHTALVPPKQVTRVGCEIRVVIGTLVSAVGGVAAVGFGFVVHKIDERRKDVNGTGDAICVGIIDRCGHQGPELRVAAMHYGGTGSDVTPRAAPGGRFVTGVIIGTVEPAFLTEVLGPRGVVI